MTGALPPPRTIPLPEGPITGALPPPVTIPLSPGDAPATPTAPPARTAPPTQTIPFPSPSGGGGGGGGGIGGPRGVGGLRRLMPGLGGAGPSQYSLDAFRQRGGEPSRAPLPTNPGLQPGTTPGEPGVGQLGTSSSGLGFSQPSGGAPAQPQWQRVLGLLRGMRF